jgi:hypothetical protein
MTPIISAAQFWKTVWSHTRTSDGKAFRGLNDNERQTFEFAEAYAASLRHEIAALKEENDRLPVLAQELAEARNDWHDDHGVPISQAYAEFMETIGNLIDAIVKGRSRIAELEKEK